MVKKCLDSTPYIQIVEGTVDVVNDKNYKLRLGEGIPPQAMKFRGIGFQTLCEMCKVLVKECNGLKKQLGLLCLGIIRVTKK